jgi:hypothetical protein
MKQFDLPLVILDNKETEKSDPWEVDVEEELRILLEHLRLSINLFLCGVAAENSSIIHWKKVDQVLDLRSMPKRSSSRKQVSISVGELPQLRVLTTGQTTFIDLSDALESLLDVLKGVREKQAEALTAPEYFPPLEEDFTERMRALSLEVLSAIQRLFEVFSERLSFVFLSEHLESVRPVELFVTMLFLYMDALIDLELLEEDGVIEDVIIRPYREE